jgi:hypothetical protein
MSVQKHYSKKFTCTDASGIYNKARHLFSADCVHNRHSSLFAEVPSVSTFLGSAYLGKASWL